MLVDTSVLTWTLQPHHALYAIADRAIERLLVRGRELHIVPQNLVELWVVATRPVDQNGLGMTPTAVAAELVRIKSMFELLPETAAIYPIWERLVIGTRYAANRRTTHGWWPPCRRTASRPF